MGRRALTLALTVSCAAVASEPATGTLSGVVKLYTVDDKGVRVPKTDHSGVVVYLTGFTEPAPPQTAEVSQKDLAFDPMIQPIVAGQKVAFANEDKVVHNIFSRSVARKFDVGKAKPGENPAVEFPKPGVVDVYCDIHESMAATVLVLPNRAFAVTGKDGRFEIKNVRAGTFTAYAYHRQSDPAKQEVTVAPARRATANFELLAVKPVVEEHLDKYGRKYKKRATTY